MSPLLPAAGVVLVSLSGASAVAVLDEETLRPVARIGVGRGPHEITLSGDGRLAYVAVAGPGPGAEAGRTVAVLDVAQRAVVATHDLPECRSPHDTRVSRDGSRLWVACAPARAVLELDAREGGVRRVFKTGRDGGWFVAVTPDAGKLYVPHLEGKALTVLDRRSGRASTLLEGTIQYGIASSPDGDEVWVTDTEARRISVVDTRRDAVVSTLSLEGGPLGRLAFAPDGARVFVAGRERLFVVDARRRRLEFTVPLPHSAKVLASSPDGRRVVLSVPGADQVMVVDVGARTVLTAAVGPGPDGVAWTR